MKNYNYFIYKMVNNKFIKTLEKDRLKINELEAIPSPQHQDVEDLCYDITRILWWQIENDMLNLHDREDEMYFFSFVDLLFRFHDIIGFDENEIYRDDKYELPFEIIYDIYDWLNEHDEYTAQVDELKHMIIKRYSENSEMYDYIYN